jgi:hypothetical protein
MNPAPDNGTAPAPRLLRLREAAAILATGLLLGRVPVSAWARPAYVIVATKRIFVHAGLLLGCRRFT